MALPQGSLLLVPAAGGVGTTTILATLGRILSLRQERVLLVDSGPRSILPLYFGDHSEATGRCLLAPPRGSAEGAVQIVTPDSSERGAADDRLQQVVQEYATGIDRVLINAWPDMAARSRDVIEASAIRLVVLIPDLHSIVKVRRIFAEAQNACESTFYLLNRFDPAVSLHQDVRQLLCDQLGDQLLPMAIRRSDDVPRAAAEGVTIADYQPDGPVSEDFKQLANWLQEFAFRQEGKRTVAAGT
jgi:cellulose biosynthesis protein BcsQ